MPNEIFAAIILVLGAFTFVLVWDIKRTEWRMMAPYLRARKTFMLRRNISNTLSPLVAIDFDALVKPPEETWFTRAFEWLRKHSFTRKLYTLFLPTMLARYKLTKEAETAGWWLVNKNLRIVILIRCPYANGLTWAVEHVVGDFPNEGFHLITSPDVAHQSMDVHQYCRGERVLRFYTRDKELARFLPSSLVRWVDTWSEDLLA